MKAAALIFRRPMHGRDPLPYSAWLRHANVPLVLFTVSRDRGDDDEGMFARVERRATFDDSGRTEERVLELALEFEFTRVFAQSEHDILRAAGLRHRLGIPGQSLDSALAYRDKLYMKRLACAAGVACAAFAPVSTAPDLRTFVADHGLPILLKPRRGAGSRGIRVLRSTKDVDSVLACPIPPDSMVESFVRGNVFHVDGLALDGHVLFASASRYVLDSLAFQTGGSMGSVLLNPSDVLSRRLIAVTRRVLLALPRAPSIAFHAELFVDTADQVLLCEIACRPGGSRTADPISIVYGVDIYEQWVKRFFGVPIELPTARREWFSVGRLLVPPRVGCLRAMPTDVPFDWVVDYRKNSRPKQRWNGAECSADHVASFLVKGRDSDEAADRMLMLDHWFRNRLDWAA